MSHRSKTTRREFIKTSAAASAGVAASNRNILRPERVLGANGRVRVAIVGAGDRMMSSLVPAFFMNAEDLNFEMAAVCDIWSVHRDENTAKIVGNSKYTAKD